MIVYDVQFTEQTPAARGPGAVRRRRPRAGHRAGDVRDATAAAAPTSSAATRTSRAAGAIAARREHDDRARRRRPALRGRGGRAAHAAASSPPRQAGGPALAPRRASRRRRVDRLPRPARHDPDRLVLRLAARARADLGAAARPHRRRRRDRADAPGRPPDADVATPSSCPGPRSRRTRSGPRCTGCPLRERARLGRLARDRRCMGVVPALATLRGRAGARRARRRRCSPSCGSSRSRRRSQARPDPAASAYPLLALLLGTVSAITTALRVGARGAAPRRAQYCDAARGGGRRARTEELRQTQLEIVSRLGRAVESRDADTGAHIDRMAMLSQRLALAARAARRPRPSCSATPPCCTTSARSASPTACCASPAASTPRSAR